jgi:hypothetical protein
MIATLPVSDGALLLVLLGGAAVFGLICTWAILRVERDCKNDAPPRSRSQSKSK